MALFDSKTALNHAIKYLADAAQKRAAGGEISDRARSYNERKQKLLQEQFPTHYMPEVGRQVMADGGSPLQPTFEAENVAAAQVSPKPGKTYGQLGGKTMNQQRIETISRRAKSILESQPVRDLVKKHFKIANYEITPVLGTWENEPEPSFRITGKNINPSQAAKLASFFSLGMWQDAAVHSIHHPEADLENGTPTVLIGHGGVLTPEERQNILSAAAEHKRDLTFTRDGKAAVFSHFGDASEHPQFVDDIENIKQKAGMPEALMVRTAGDLTDAKDYLKKIVGGTRSRERLEGGSGQPSDLFRGLVDHIAAPFTRAAEQEGYRFSTQKFADFHKLTDAEKNYFFSKVVPPERRPPSGIGYSKPTVRDPVGYEYPGIYGDPRELVAEAVSRVAPESENLKKLFGVTRADLYDIGKNRVGNMEPTLAMAPNPKGSLAAENIMTPQNEQRLRNILEEAGKYHSLRHGMDAWYVMDPLFQVMVKQFGLDEAKNRYKVLNTLKGMASPGSEVPTEINRGMAAYYMHNQGRFPEFVEHGGKSAERRGADFPAEIADVMGHPYHSTSQAGPMQRFLQSGEVEMGTPKVPTYIPASGVPEIGFQTKFPVPDAHYTRIIGMGDTRTSMDPGVSMKMPEYQQVAPWWERNIANPMGLQSVAAQGRIWGAGSGATGVSSPIGAPKLEMFADYIAGRAARHGISSEDAMKRILEGSMYRDGGTVHEPHQRAEEQGYSIRGYHVTRGHRAGQISSAKRFDPYMAEAPGEEATFFWDNPNAANDWASHMIGEPSFNPEEMSLRGIDRAERHATAVMPVRIHPGKSATIDWEEATGQKFYNNKKMAQIIRHARDLGFDTLRIKNMIEGEMPDAPRTPEEAQAYTPHDQIAVLNPHVIRSEFAEFDPEKRGQNDIGAARGGTIEGYAHGGAVHREHFEAGGFSNESYGGSWGGGGSDAGTAARGGDTPGFGSGGNGAVGGGGGYGSNAGGLGGPGDTGGGNGGGNGGGGRDYGGGGGGGNLGRDTGGGSNLGIGFGGGGGGDIGRISGGFGAPGAMGSFGAPNQGQAADASNALAPGRNIGAAYLGAALSGGRDLNIGGPQGLTGAPAFGQPNTMTPNYNMGNQPNMTIGGSMVPQGVALGQQMATPPEETRESWLAKNYPESPRLGDLAQPTPAAPFATRDRAGSMASMPMGATPYGSDLTPMSSQPARPISQTPFSGYPQDVQNAMIPRQPDSAFRTGITADPTGAQTAEALKNMGVASDALTMMNAPGLAGSFVRAFMPTPTPATPQQQASINRMYQGTLEGGVPADFATPQGMAARYGAPGAAPLAHPGQTSDAYLSAGPSASIGRQDMPVSRPSAVGAGSPVEAYDRGATSSGTNVRSNFNNAFAEARARGADTFEWTNPLTGQKGLYTTQLGRKEGGRVPSLANPNDWIAQTEKTRSVAKVSKPRKASKVEGTAIVNRAVMLSSRKS